jgi:hypothetical protein
MLASFDSLGVPVDRDRVQLHRGLFDATLKPSGAVAFAHIDCDSHDPVRLCLDRIYPHLSPGAWVVADDYFVYGGARRAIDDFLAVHADVTVVPTRAREHLVLRRTGPTLNA